jgi:outer membrane protein assembly factor BamB
MFAVGVLVALIAAPVAPAAPDGPLIALKECWHYGPAIADAQPAADSNNVYIAENGGRVSAISLSTGTRIWSTELGGEVVSDLVSDTSNIYVVTNEVFGGAHLRSLSVASGIPNWDVEYPGGRHIMLGTFGGKLVVVMDTGVISAYRPGMGKAEWNLTLPMNITGMYSGAGKMLIATADREVHSVDVASGKQMSTYSMDADITATAVFGEGVVIGDDRGNIVRFASGSRSWRFRNGARITSLTHTVRGLIAASADNFVYLISDDTGDVRWKKRLPGRVANVAIAGDTAVVTAIGEPDAFLIDLETGKAAGRLSLGSGEVFIGLPLFSDGKFIFFTSAGVLAASQSPCSGK